MGNLVNYQRTSKTRERSQDQVDAVVDFLGNNNLLIMRTPGTAANEEFHELEAAKLTNSRIFFYEVDNAVITKNLAVASDALDEDLLAVLPEIPGSILDAPWDHEDVYDGIWWDWDGTKNPTRIVNEHYHEISNLLDYLFSSKAKRIVVSITMSWRPGRYGTTEEVQDNLDKLVELLECLGEEACDSYAVAVESYNSGNTKGRTSGKGCNSGSYMVVVDAFYRRD